MKRKGIALLLVACMISVMLSACGPGGGGAAPADDGDATVADAAQDQDTDDVDDAEEAAPPVVIDPYGPITSGERVRLTVGRPESPNVTFEPGEDSFNNYVVRFLSEQLNIEYYYEFSVDAPTYVTKVAMQIASGDIPDVMNVTYPQLRQLVDAGMLADLTSAFDTFSSEALRRVYDSTNGISFDLATFDGRLMALPAVFPGMDSVPVLYLRGDWMDELGLEAPETIEDIANIVLAFREHNPGGNVNAGLAVETNIFDINGGLFRLNAFAYSLNAFPRLWQWDEDGTTVKYGSVQPEMREALLVIRDLVERGVVDASFAVRDGATCRELVYSSQSGAFFGAWWSAQWVTDMLVAEDDSVRWDVHLAPFSADGYINAAMRNPSPNFVVVREGVSDDIKEAVVKTINWQHRLDYDQAMEIRPHGMDTRFSWHFFPINILHIGYTSKEDKARDIQEVMAGRMEFEDLNGDAQTWFRGYTTVREIGWRAAAEENISTVNAYGWARGAMTVYNNNHLINRVFGATYAESPTMEARWGPMLTLEEETFLKILTGEVGIEAFDDFVAQWHALGGDDIIQELTEIANANR